MAIAFLGAGSSFIECTLGQVYKEEIDGEYRGGPAYYIEKAMGVKWYAFAVATVIGWGFLGPSVQSNSIAAGVTNAFGINPFVTGAVTTALLAWALGDIAVGTMAWLNVIAILILGNIGLKVLKDYEEQKKMGRNADTFIFDPKKLGIKNANAWYAFNERRVKRASEKDSSK